MLSRLRERRVIGTIQRATRQAASRSRSSRCDGTSFMPSCQLWMRFSVATLNFRSTCGPGESIAINADSRECGRAVDNAGLIEQDIEARRVVGQLHTDHKYAATVRSKLSPCGRHSNSAGNGTRRKRPLGPCTPTSGKVKRHQVLAVHPDRVIGLQAARHRFGEYRVDCQARGQLRPAEFGETDAAMQQRPQLAIGEAAIVAMAVGLIAMRSACVMCGAIGVSLPATFRTSQTTDRSM